MLHAVHSIWTSSDNSQHQPLLPNKAIVGPLTGQLHTYLSDMLALASNYSSAISGQAHTKMTYYSKQELNGV
jgi:hypothetical protein